MTRTFTTYLHFLWTGLVKLEQTGAVVPSQRFLIARMLAPVPPAYRGRIVELGAGNGAITRRLAARCPHATIVACEINPALARDCRDTVAADGLDHRVTIVSGAAQHLLSEMARKGASKPDFILSGIPLGNLPRELVLTLVEKIHRCLAEGGMYIQFQHSLLDRKTIRAAFPKLRTVPAFLNFPPAFVYYARK